VKEKNGYGLGLYISKYLINKMGGDILCENLEDGFSVIILLKLAG
jgi:signal transduction histidine kinase